MSNWTETGYCLTVFSVSDVSTTVEAVGTAAIVGAITAAFSGSTENANQDIQVIVCYL